MGWRSSCDAQGRVSIPVEVLRAVGVAEAGFVSLSVTGDCLVIERVKLGVAPPAAAK